MASTAQFEGNPAPQVRPRLARSPDLGLAAFRSLVTLDHERSLSTLIESEIIPRLLIAHAADAGDSCSPPVDSEEIAALAPLALQVQADSLLVHIETILARGVSVEAVMVDLLAPAARLLGEFWEEDRCDFVDVTMGLWRLQEVVHEIAARRPPPRVPAAHHYSALFAAMPGDQHNFGTVVIEEVFRRDGWMTDRLGDAETPTLLKRVGDDWFDLVGLTVSCDRHVALLPALITGLRTVSRNPGVCIMVGGRVFSADPDLAAVVGADATARDARLALRTAARIVRLREEQGAARSAHPFPGA